MLALEVVRKHKGLGQGMKKDPACTRWTLLPVSVLKEMKRFSQSFFDFDLI